MYTFTVITVSVIPHFSFYICLNCLILLLCPIFIVILILFIFIMYWKTCTFLTTLRLYDINSFS